MLFDLIDSSTGDLHVTTRLLHQDQLAFLCLVNEIYESAPDRFGASSEVRERLRTEMRSVFLKYDSYAEINRYLLKDVAAIFKRHHLDPFADQEILFIAPDAGAFDIARAAFGGNHIHTIPNHHYVTSDNISTLLNGKKMTAVITGNALNADNDDAADLIRACAIALKKGGIAIHMLWYGEGSALYSLRPDDQKIDSGVLHESAGQKLIRNIPNGPYEPHGAGRTLAMILRQTRAIDEPSQDEPSRVVITPHHESALAPQKAKLTEK
jgi:hypothetical protein